MRHGTLNTIGTLWRIFGFMAILGGVVGGIVLAMSNQIFVGIVAGVSGVITCVSFLTIAEVINLLIDVEYHLRSNNPKFQQKPDGAVGGKIAQRKRSKQQSEEEF